MVVRRRILLAVVSALALGCGLVAAPVPPVAHAGTPALPAPDPDPFYAAPPDLAAHHNGDVLRTRKVDVARYGPANGWQILFRSTNADGQPIAAVTTLMVPFGNVAHRPLLSFQPLTNSLGLQCAPSHALFDGGVFAAPAIPAALLHGWAVAIPDHLGPKSAYGAAQLGGHIVLDGARAAERLPQAGLGGSPVGLAGYSGGALASGWAATLAPSYAPELNIVGAAVGGLPANLQQIAKLGTAPNPLFGLGFAAAMGLEREYPNRMPLSQNLNGQGIALRNQIANMCTQDLINAGAGKSIAQITKNPDLLDSPSAQALLRENSLEFFGGAPRAPMYVWQGGSDVLVHPDTVAATVHHWCSAGTRVQYSVLPGLDHGPASVVGAPQAIAYMQGRFDGAPPPSNC